MQIPMEIMSQMVKGTDFGIGLSQQRASPQIRDNSKFARAVEDALARTSSLPGKEFRQKSMIPGHKLPGLPSEPDEEPDEILAIGVIGDQELIVSVLEGDKESATTPELQTDAVGTANTRQSSDSSLVTDFKAIEANTQTEATEGIRTEANETQNSANKAQAANTAFQEAMIESELAASQGEVTARTPSIRTSERSENMETNSKSTDIGNLSPLENENETAPIKEQTKSSNSDMTHTGRRSAEEAEQPNNSAMAPLAEGIKPERFRADQQMKQTTLDAPVKAENLFEEMISRIDSMKTDTTHSMTIQLKPEFLGNVALELMVDAAGLHLKIDAANSDVRAMISGQINTLIETLGQKGIEVVAVEVTHTGIDNGVSKESSGRHAQSSNPKNRYRGVNPSDRLDIYTSLPIDALQYYLDVGVSSVEYSA